MSNETLPMEIEPALARMKEFSATPDQLIPLLQFMQGEIGYLAPFAISAIAEYLRLPTSHVYGVATFYAQFRFKPLGKNRITCCRGTACHVRGGKKIIDELSQRLKIGDGGTTDDLQFSLETVACVGSCALAPVVVVNNRLYGKVTPKKMKQAVDELMGIAPAVEAPEESEAEEKKPAAAPKPEAKPTPTVAAAPSTPAEPAAPKPAPPAAPAPQAAPPAPPAKPEAPAHKAKPAAASALKKPAAKRTAAKKSKPAAKKAATRPAPKPAVKKAAPKAKPAAQKSAKTAKPAKKARPGKAAKPASRAFGKKRAGVSKSSPKKPGTRKNK